MEILKKPHLFMATAAVVAGSIVSGSAHAAFPGANGRIVFASYDGDGAHIYTTSPSGNSLRRLSDAGADPAWSPDGTAIAFTDRARDSETAVFTMRSDGSRVRRVTPKGVGAYEPSWSPDGERLLFTVEENQQESLYTIGADGKDLTPLTDLPGNEYMAAWAPDGTRIAFVMSDPLYLTHDLYTVAPDGSDLTRLTHDPFDQKYAPNWSPDGGSLVYERYAVGANQGELVLIGADGLGEQQITNTGWDENWPSFSPDGQFLLFGSNKDGDWDIYTMRLDGSGLRKLTHNTSDEHVADWESVGR